MVIKAYKDCRVVDCGEDVLKNRNNVIIYKQDDSYIIRKNNVYTIVDYNDMLYSVYIRDRYNHDIYFVNTDDEEVESISLTGKEKREYVLPIYEIETNPFYEDEKYNVFVKMKTNENIVDIDYSVLGKNGEEESFNVKMNHVYDVELTYEEGDIVNTEYLNKIKPQLEDKFKTYIELKKINSKEKIYSI